jgi:hypothetical protein
MVAGILMTGCAAQPPAMPVGNVSPAQANRTASALVFDAPITFDQPPIDLPRDVRGPAAFVGFQDTTVSYFDTVSDTIQGSCGPQFIQDSFSERTGSIRR